ncbi:MAG: hypothetical protein JST82_04965 [Bacteroidetes bacterium]|nr:hypothetical protein [Bacteroidota bacterium]
MNIAGRGFVLLLLLIASHNVFAQDVTEDEGIASKKGYSRQLGIGAGATYRRFLDDAISDIQYHRIGAIGSIANMKTNENKYTELTFQGSYLKMGHNKIDASSILKHEVKDLKLTFDYRHMLKVNLLDQMLYDVRLGGAFSGLFDYKKAPMLETSYKVYEYAVDLGLTGKIARQLYYNGRQCYAIIDATLPIFSNYARPPYLNRNHVLDPAYKESSYFFGNNKMAFVGKKCFRFNTRVHYLYPLKNGNKLRFTYQWDFYKMKQGETTVYSAEHSIIMAFLFNY